MTGGGPDIAPLHAMPRTSRLYPPERLRISTTVTRRTLQGEALARARELLRARRATRAIRTTSSTLMSRTVTETETTGQITSTTIAKPRAKMQKTPSRRLERARVSASFLDREPFRALRRQNDRQRSVLPLRSLWERSQTSATEGGR